MCKERVKVERRVMKMSSVAGVYPTVPTSDDHTDGSWVATDIYVGEEFFNSADGILYTRSASGIVVVTPNAGLGTKLRFWVGLLTQAGVAAPVPTVLVNSLGGTLVFARTGANTFTATLAGAFPVNKVFCFITVPTSAYLLVAARRLDNNTVEFSYTEGIGGTTQVQFEIIVYP